MNAKLALPTEHLCDLKECTNEISTIVDRLRRIKIELEITHFSEVMKELSRVLEKIFPQKFIFSIFFSRKRFYISIILTKTSLPKLIFGYL